MRIAEGNLDRRRREPGFVGDSIHVQAGVTVELQDFDAHAVHVAEIQRLAAPPIGRSGRETDLGGLRVLAAPRQQRELAAIGPQNRLRRLARPEDQQALDALGQGLNEAGQQNQQAGGRDRQPGPTQAPARRRDRGNVRRQHTQQP